LYNQSQQSYHTAGYRGNIQGHDNYLRADSQQPTSGMQGGNMAFTSQSGFSAPVTSQYSGMQRTFQPTGYVQSVYGQGGQSYSSQYQSQAVSPSSFHGANYRGNQPGHDNYLRADSTAPTSFTSQSSFMNQYQPAQTSMQFTTGAMQNSQFQNSQFQSPYQQQFTQSMQSPQSPSSYHMANYQGNQPGHDNYLRADSQQPTQFGRNSTF